LFKLKDSKQRKFQDFEGNKAVYKVTSRKEINGEEKEVSGEIRIIANKDGLDDLSSTQLDRILKNHHRQVITDFRNNELTIDDPVKKAEKFLDKKNKDHTSLTDQEKMEIAEKLKEIEELQAKAEKELLTGL